MWQSNDNFIFEEINQQSINDLISQSNHPSIHPSNNWSINNRYIYCRSSCACRWPWGADCFVWSRSFCAPLTCSLPSRTSTRARTGSRSRCVNVRPPTGGTVSASSFFPRVRLAEFFLIKVLKVLICINNYGLAIHFIIIFFLFDWNWDELIEFCFGMYRNMNVYTKKQMRVYKCINVYR